MAEVNKNINPKVSEKSEFNKSFDAMKQEAYRWTPAWKDLSTYIDPTRGIFNGDRTKIGKMIDHKTLLDSHATHSKRITSSGMQTGMTDPARPWFKLTMDNFILDNVPGVREWLDEVSRRMIEVMNKSNIYNVFQNCYDELVQFGIGCFLILEDFDDIIRGRSFTVGEYFLRVDNKGKVNAFAREFEMTVGQMVEEFGLESCSPVVRAHFQDNRVDIKIKIRHLIESNKSAIPDMEDFENMPFRSVYWENGEGSDNFLGRRGYKRFPVVSPAWDRITTDMIYAYGPGWHALGDIKELQVTHKDELIAQEKVHTPPMQKDGSVIGNANFLPGGITSTSSNVPNSGVRPAYQINPDLSAFADKIERLHQKIDRHLFADIFLMISNLEGDITAFEVAKRDQERLMQLGPILHNSNKDMHAPTIDLIFGIMSDNGMIPEPPPGIEGLEIKVQYISILAQAQKAMGIQQISQVIGYVASLNQINPTMGQYAADNLDIDDSVREVNDLSGAPAKLIKPKGDVDAIRKERQDQQNKAVALQAGTQAADAAAKLGKTPMNQGSVLDGIAHAASR